MAEMEVLVNVVAEGLDQVDFSKYGGSARLGIQRGTEVEQVVPAEGESVTFSASFRVESLPDGTTNFLGPYAQGPRDERFVYLCWSEPSGNRFGRVKLKLGKVPFEDLRDRAELVLRVSLVGKGGGPLFASVLGTWE